MKKIKHLSFLLASILLLSCLIPLGGYTAKKVKALHPDFSTSGSYIYYFSDSAPTFKETLEDNYPSLSVFYDTRFIVTPREFEFLLYSGYFWGFESGDCVIIEIKTFDLPFLLMEKLVECLDFQGCKVMIISPSISNVDAEGQNYYMPCNMDNFTRFLKYNTRKMLDGNGVLRDNTYILFCEKFFRLTPGLSSYDFSQVCASSPYLRRILMYLYTNCNTSLEWSFEEDLYRHLWDEFEDVLNDYEFGERDYLDEENPNIFKYCESWGSLYSDYNLDFDWHSWYEENLKNYIWDYYKDIIDPLAYKNVHMLAHIDGTKYLDLLDYSYIGDTPLLNNFYTFTDCDSVVDSLNNPYKESYLYSMGITSLSTPYFNLLYSLHNIGTDNQNFVIHECAFIWEYETVNYDPDGLNSEVWNSSMVFDDDIPIEDLISAFLFLFDSFLY